MTMIASSLNYFVYIKCNLEFSRTIFLAFSLGVIQIRFCAMQIFLKTPTVLKTGSDSLEIESAF